MDEDLEGVDTMISHRTQRPSFARMISWEMSKGSSPRRRRPSKKSKRRTTSIVVEDVNDNCELDDESELFSDSDSSVYLTAEENASESDSDHLAESTASMPSVFSDLSVSTGMSINSTNSTSDCGGERRRRPSKKQKKMKKRKFKLQFFDMFSSCSNEDRFDFDPFGFSCYDVNELIEDSKSVQVTKNIPCLVELCLRSVWKSGLKFTEKPHGLMHKIYSQKNLNTFSSLQLQMLHKHLSRMEDMDTYSLTDTWKYDGSSRSDYQYIVWRAKRNIWNGTSIEPPNRADNNPVYTNYHGCKASSFIRWTSFSLLLENENLFDRVATWHALVSTIAGLGHTIDFMLPSTIMDKTRKSFTEEDDLNKQNIKTAVTKVKQALKARFPTLIDKLFDEALAYTFWARGNISQAVEMFVKLADQTEKSLDKAMFLSEVARMYAQLDDQSFSLKFIRLASDAASEVGRTGTKDSGEINQQLLMLMANVYDQGLMTESKARESATMWSSVYNQEHFLIPGLKAAFDSFLCFHCGSMPGSTSHWLSEAEQKLKPLLLKHPTMHLYYSTVLAMQGKDEPSHQAFRDYHYKGMEPGTSGTGNSTFNSSYLKTNIWQPLVYESYKTPICPMRVIWRTQLQSLFIARDVTLSNAVSDYCDNNLQLRVSPDGYITGNMQQLLPPLRGIYLDPYTGQRVVKSNPSETETWVNANPNKEVYNSADKLFLPTPQEVYSDENGTKVQLLCSSECLYGGYDRFNSMVSFHWSNREGKKAKVNVLPAMKKLEYDSAFDLIQKNAVSQKKTKEWTAKMEEILNYMNTRGMTLSYWNIECYVRNYLASQKKAEKGGKKFVEPKVPKYARFGVEIYKIVQYGQSLFINLGEINMKNVFLFFNCATAETFKDFKTSVRTTPLNFPRSKIPNLRNNKVPGTVLWVAEGGSGYVNNCPVFDFKGNQMVQPPPVSGDDSVPAISTPCILGHTLYGVHEHKRKILINTDCGESLDEIGEFPQIEGLNTAGNKILLHTVDGVSFLDSETMFPCVITIDGRCPFSITTNEDSNAIAGKFRNIEVLQEKKLKEVTRCVISLDSFVCVVDLALDSSVFDLPVVVKLCVMVPGLPKEATTVESMGLLVSATLNERVQLHREIVYYFNFSGKLLRILPMLGPGPRSFCLNYFPKNKDLNKRHSDFGKGGLHLFMNDGHGGIIGVLLLED